ncbi:hypothetical protein F0562_017100 [Nyssa sinensis]|uniref:Transcription repressor n=1 Tax=Nyssa sinensis TaxID=561372 RepID=A0A5J4ZE62_9ASTE|nr:hypothetical protein F0562_017100 [Nyssa sinensis]
MGKKMKLPFPFKNAETTSSWPWPSCGSPKTLSFRADNDLFKMINSAFVDTPESSVTNSSESRRFSTAASDDASGGGESVEMVIKGLRSERLFFEPGETNSILEEAKKDGFPFKESTAVMAMDSQDPYTDFKTSMEEMVEAHDLKDWECLEELLSWYLRVNDKNNHGYIIGAFVDLLIGLAIASSSSSHNHFYSATHSPTSPLSFSSSNSSTSPCLSSSLEAEDEIEKTYTVEKWLVYGRV